MATRMLIDASHEEETRVVIVKGNKLEEFDFEVEQRKPLKGNIYLAKVTRVEPSLQAAFVDFGGNRHGFLAFSEIHPDYYQIPVADREALIAQQRAEEARYSDDDDEDVEDLEAEDLDDEDEIEDGDDLVGDDDDIDAEQAATATEEDPDVDTEAEAAADEAVDDTGAAADESDDSEDSDPNKTVTLGDEDDVVSEDVPAEDAAAEEAEPEEDAAIAEPGESADTLAAEAAPAADEGAEQPDAEETVTDAAPAEAEVDDAVAVDAPADDAAAPAEVEAEASTEADEDTAEAAEAPADENTEADAEAEASGETAAEEENGEEESRGKRDSRRSRRGRGRNRRRRGRSNDRNEDEDESVDNVGGDELEDEVQRRRRSPGVRPYKIQEVIKRRQILLVQVVKEERGNKGAALTTYLSLPGRYCVLMPNTARGGGISRKISNVVDRKRLKTVMKDMEVPDGTGVIVRTAGAKRTKLEIRRDFEFLLKLWDDIRDKTLQSTAPALVYEEASLITRSIRDLYSKEIDEVLVEGETGYRQAKDFMKRIMPSHAKKVQPYRDRIPLLHRYQIDDQLDTMYNPEVTLPSGGYIVINPTEALVAIDVNSGKSTKGRSIEETATRTNLEAAEEVARQLRLRDLAGLIVIDYIDMEESRNNRAVERKMKEALKSDRARIQVGRISHFGLMEMSRQRLRPGVLDVNTATCQTCNGTGIVRSIDSTALLVLRAIEEEGIRDRAAEIRVVMPTEVAIYIMNKKRDTLMEVEQRYGFRVELSADQSMIPPDYRIERLRNKTAADRQDEKSDDNTEEPVEAEEDQNDNRAAEGEENRDKPKRRRRRRRGKSSDRDQDNGEANENTDESAADADAEASPDAPSGDGESDDDGEGNNRRRRRGRRGGRRRRGRNNEDEQATVEGEGEVAAEGESAPEGDNASDPAAAEQQPEADAGAASEEAVTAEADDAVPQPEEVAATAADEAVEAPAEEVEAAATEEAAEEPAAEEVIEDVAPVEENAEPVAVEAETGAEESPAEETAEEAAPTEEAVAETPAETVVEEEKPEEPPKPKRFGWWSRS